MIKSPVIASVLFVLTMLPASPPASAANDAVADPRMIEHALSAPNAPLRMDEYYSLDCSHCAEFDINVLPRLKKDYIDTGKVYLVLHDFPRYEPALRAFQLARCLPLDRFLPMVDTLFKVQQGWLRQNMPATLDALKQQAKFAGLTDSQIDACLADKNLEDEILNERVQAEKSVGINATPTFIFNQNKNDRLEEAGPYEDFANKIDGMLKK